MNWTQIFREDLNCYALSIFRVFILLASSDSDKHVNEAKSVNKDSPIAEVGVQIPRSGCKSRSFLNFQVFFRSSLKSVQNCDDYVNLELLHCQVQIYDFPINYCKSSKVVIQDSESFHVGSFL